MENTLETPQEPACGSDMDFTTHEPTIAQKLMQVYWFNPKSWLLKRFKVEDGMLTIETLNGKIFTAPVDSCEFTYQEDDYCRHEIYVKAGDKKIHFKEIPFMLEDEEWDTIVDFCCNGKNSKETVMGKLVSVFRLLHFRPR